MVDLIVIGIIAFSVLISLWRGFTNEALSLLGWVIAFFVANSFYPYLSGYLTQINCSGFICKIQIFTQWYCSGDSVSFDFNCLWCDQRFIRQVIDLSGMSITDRILGGAFRALRGIFSVSAILFFLRCLYPSKPNGIMEIIAINSAFDFIVKWFFEQLQTNSVFNCD
ncbi:CvpA family protein [Mannheimia haemolytica]|nr:CvpA family protein [Mannheimia haemolytica]